MNATIKFQCVCGQSIEVNADAAGQSFNCPSCNAQMVVPSTPKQKSWVLGAVVAVVVILITVVFVSSHSKTIPLAASTERREWNEQVARTEMANRQAREEREETERARQEAKQYFLLWKTPHSIRYKILDATDRGSRIVSVLFGEEREDDVFVVGLVGYSGRVYEGNMAGGNLLVKQLNDFTYTTVQGSTRRIPCYQVATDAIRLAWVP